MRVDHLLPARNLRQIQYGLPYGRQPADMSDQRRRIQHAAGHQIGDFPHIPVRASLGPDYMRRIVMHPEIIDRRLQTGIPRSGKEIQAAVDGQDLICLHQQRLGRRHHQYIVKTISCVTVFFLYALPG